jgi:nitroimidazol reductase NimA-like FMN-containing flavoprotein (pyridoxamine 5'-phosphate oxidase superfamily)
MARLTDDELAEFLAGPVICRLGCLDDDGWPRVVPVWMQHADDGGFYLVPRERSAWARYLQRDGRVSLCLDERADHRRVLVRGHARILEEPNVGGRWVPILREMAERYWGERGVEYHTRSLAEPRWLVFVEPLQITSWHGTWAERYKHYPWQLGTATADD